MRLALLAALAATALYSQEETPDHRLRLQLLSFMKFCLRRIEAYPRTCWVRRSVL
jgi:hypothetical protein